MRVLCVTLNLKGLEAWHNGRDRLAALGLSKLSADLVCLQEVVIQDSPYFYDQLDYLAQSLQLEHQCFSPYGNDSDASGSSQKGIGLLSRWPINRTEIRCLPPGGPQDKRTAIMARIARPEGPMLLVNTHLSWEPEKGQTRLEQMRTILKSLQQSGQLRDDVPLIVAGDMNAAEHDPAMGEARALLLDAWRLQHSHEAGYTWLRDNPLADAAGKYLPDRRVDYIFCNRSARVHRAEIVFNRAEDNCVSDHFGVLADLEWKL